MNIKYTHTNTHTHIHTHTHTHYWDGKRCVKDASNPQSLKPESMLSLSFTNDGVQCCGLRNDTPSPLRIQRSEKFSLISLE